jgi:hypothetical protein
VRVACSNGPTVEAPEAKMTSGARAANSAACLRTASTLAVPIALAPVGTLQTKPDVADRLRLRA